MRTSVRKSERGREEQEESEPTVLNVSQGEKSNLVRGICVTQTQCSLCAEGEGGRRRGRKRGRVTNRRLQRMSMWSD